MKDYTLIYTDSFMCGSHWNTLVRMARITLEEGQTLKDVFDDYGGSVVMIFEGHPKLEGEE